MVAAAQHWPRTRLLDDARYGAVHGLHHVGAKQAAIAALLNISESVVCNALRQPTPPSARVAPRHTKRKSALVRRRQQATKAVLTKREFVAGEVKKFKSGRPPKDPNWVRPFTVTVVPMLRLPTGSLRRATRQLKQDGFKTSRTTVMRDRKAVGLIIKTRSCAPLLTEPNKLERVRLLKPWARLKPDDPIFKSLIFSDEKLFDVDHHGSKLQYLDPIGGKRADPRLFAGQGGAKVMVFGAIGVGWRKLIIFTEGTIDSDKYYEEALKPIMRKLKGRGIHFMQDGATIHTSAATLKNLRGVVLIDWPAHSPDANGIEILWARLAVAVSERGPLGREQLITFIEEEWKKIPQDYIDSLVMRFHSQCVRIVAANGEIV
jgi:transposase